MQTFQREDGTYLTAYNVEDFPYGKYRIHQCSEKRFGKKRQKVMKTIEIVASFDIETTSINKIVGSVVRNGEEVPKWDSFGFMYHWQFALEDDVCFGRTWEEFLEFYENIVRVLEVTPEKKFIVFVHNLGFEFQFMNRFLNWDSVFATKPRKVLFARTSEGVEFRCSYKLSNMSLDKFCETTPNMAYQKKTGKYDYKTIRTPITPMTDEELEYCYCDVAGLNECIRAKMKDEGDTLSTIPFTSTGYIRRLCRNAMHKNKANRAMFLRSALTPKLYVMMLEAMRGGNTSSSRYHCNTRMEDVYSFDAASCYPYVMMTKKFPVERFISCGNERHTMDYYEDLMRRRCCIFHVRLHDVVVKEDVPIAYIAAHRCLSRKGAKLFNNRVLRAEMVEMTITEVDWWIIKDQYDFDYDNIEVADFHHAKAWYLPKELKKCIMELFYNKTSLKKADPYFYTKSKNLLNAIFGMCCSAIVHDDIDYNAFEKESMWLVNRAIEPDFTVEELDAAIGGMLRDYYNKDTSFLPYQWGVWTTAHARAHLQRIIDTNKEGTIYCDTDSDKMVNPDFDALEKLNADIMAEDESFGAYCDFDGKRYYLGVFENEEKNHATDFITKGAKKYCYVTDDGKLHITIAGVNKKKGVVELEMSGGIDAFQDGFVFGRLVEGAGGLEVSYNDDGIHKITVDGCAFTTASNCGMRDGEYTLKTQPDVFEAIALFQTMLD